jgi:hypothetical protein
MVPFIMLSVTDEYYHGNSIVNTHQRREIRLLVLIPHRDARKLLRAWSGALFAAGMAGAWAFPWAAPLACLSRFLSARELRDAACALRELAGKGDGKFRGREAAISPFPPDGTPTVYGPRLEPGGFESVLSGGAAAKPVAWFSPPVLGAALMTAPSPNPLPEPPAISFRAAALANMLISPLEGGDRDCSFEWDIGPLRWLPPGKKEKEKT